MRSDIKAIVQCIEDALDSGAVDVAQRTLESAVLPARLTVELQLKIENAEGSKA